MYGRSLGRMSGCSAFGTPYLGFRVHGPALEEVPPKHGPMILINPWHVQFTMRCSVYMEEVHRHAYASAVTYGMQAQQQVVAIDGRDARNV